MGVEISHPMSYSASLIENKSAAKFATQLDADLSTGVRGGNKFRLVARCWVATNYGADCGLDSNDYDRFRDEWSRQTFAKIHQAFDHVLPQQFRANKGPAPAAAPVAKELTKKAQKLAKSFDRTTDLTAEQRAWVLANGGVEALDARKMRLPNGRVFPFLDTSWYLTAQHIQGVIDGRRELD